jgi:aspartate/methionine/tyrosine aminotransferase
MTGFFAEGDLTPNRLEIARRRKQLEGGYLDLTGSNPTSQGLLFPPEILQTASTGYWKTRLYKPDPFGGLPAREAIAHYYASRTPPLSLSVDNIFITASTSEAYSHLFALLCQPGDNVLMPEVTYPLFEYLAAIHHVELRSYRMDEAARWSLIPDSLREQVDEHTRAILLISPHNPTGMIIQSAQAVLEEIGLPLICDEVFAEFTYRATHTPPLGALHPTLPIFHLNGISKLFALPDMKLGWIVLSGSAFEYRDRLELLNDTYLSASSLVQYMLPTLFEQGMPFVTAMTQRVRDSLYRAIEVMGHSRYLKVTPPDGGYYLFPKVETWSDEEALALYLLEQGVLVHPGYYYGYEGAGAHIMVSCLTEPETLFKGLEILVRALG